MAERIASFDNDGTLWGEQPVPVQLYFALDRVKALEPQTEWKTKETPGQGLFPYFRFYAPTEAFFDRSWALPDIDQVK